MQALHVCQMQNVERSNARGLIQSSALHLWVAQIPPFCGTVQSSPIRKHSEQECSSQYLLGCNWILRQLGALHVCFLQNVFVFASTLATFFGLIFTQTGQEWSQHVAIVSPILSNVHCAMEQRWKEQKTPDMSRGSIQTLPEAEQR